MSKTRNPQSAYKTIWWIPKSRIRKIILAFLVFSLVVGGGVGIWVSAHSPLLLVIYCLFLFVVYGYVATSTADRTNQRYDAEKEYLYQIKSLGSDEPINTQKLFDIEDYRFLARLRRAPRDVMLKSEIKQCDPNLSVSSPSGKRQCLGRFIAAGFGEVTDVCKVNEDPRNKDWVVTLFSDNSRAIANATTNEIACTCQTGNL